MSGLRTRLRGRSIVPGTLLITSGVKVSQIPSIGMSVGNKPVFGNACIREHFSGQDQSQPLTASRQLVGIIVHI